MTLEKIKTKFITHSFFMKKALPVSIFISSIVMYFYNPTANLNVSNFDRIIGNGLLNGIEIEKRISQFYTFYLILFPMVFGITFYSLSKLYNKIIKRKSQEQLHAIKFLNDLSIIAIVPMGFLYINKFSKDINLFENFTILLVAGLILAILSFILLNKFIVILFNTFMWLVLLSYSICFPILFLIGRKQINSLKFVFVYIFVVGTLTIIVNILIMKKKLNDSQIVKLQISLTPLMYGLACVSFFLEITNILNQYNFIIYNKQFISILIYVFLGIISWFIYMFSRKFDFKPLIWENLYYPALIMSIALISVQPSLQTFIATDLFESANHGLAISEFFQYGKIPLIETFDAHMMSNTFWGIIYGVLNNDTFGAIFIVYGKYIMPILLLMFYKIMKEFFDCNFVFFITILLPLPVINLEFGFLAIISLIFALKKDTFLSYLLYWFSLVLICVYKLDSGAAYSLATMFSLLVTYLLFNQRHHLKRAGAALFVTLSSCGIVYLLVCTYKGINCINRLKEILVLAKSNVNWAYAEIGDTSKFTFFFCYSFVPIIVVSTLIFIFHTIINKKILISVSQLVILSSLAIAYIFNITRTMVRHSLAENRVQYVLYSSILFLSLAASLLCKKHRKVCFISLFATLSIFTNILGSNQNIQGNTLSDTFFVNISGDDLFSVKATEKVKRVVLEDKYIETFGKAVQSIKSIMNENETYIDFTNQSLLYALSGKEKIVYVNQSPGLLCGEFSQEQFINQIEDRKNDAIFALLPANEKMNFSTNIDEISNAFRYYKLSEYISKEFVPFCTFDNYALWVKNDYIQEIQSRCKLIYDDFQITEISENSLSNLVVSDAEVELEGDSFIIESGTADPQIEGLFNNVNFSIYDNEKCNIAIEYESNLDGIVKLYYTTEEHEGFGESKSIEIDSKASPGVFRFMIPTTEFTKLRLDTIAGSKIKLNKLSIIGDKTYINCSYNYGTVEDLHTYNLRKIPYIWGSYDVNKAYNNTIIRDALTQSGNYYKINFNKISKDEGNYIIIKAKSKGIGTCSISIGLNTTGGYITKSVFNIDLAEVEGVNTYLLRVSSDFFWYSNLIDSLKIESTIPLEDIDVQILKGD